MDSEDADTPEERAAAWAEFLSEVEDPLAHAAALKHPAVLRGQYACYQSTSDLGGHYRIQSYGSDGSLVLIHGADSTLPGMQVFGAESAETIPCNCGRWQ